MPRVGLHCSHEQIPPSRLLRAARRAQEAGFDLGMSSDHFSPWSARQGESGFAWSFLGAALATTDLPFGVSLYNDSVGSGITGVRCGVDLTKTATPSGATSYAVEVTVLDGQAVFPQYVTRVAGNNTPIVQVPELGGEMITRCRNEPAVCVASWHARGLVVTVRLRGPRTDQSEAQVGQLLHALVRVVVANVAKVPVP